MLRRHGVQLIFLLFAFVFVIGCDAAVSSDVDSSKAPNQQRSQQQEEKNVPDILSDWERLKKDKNQQEIKKKCNCENDPDVKEDDGESSYYYRLMKCRSECKI